MFADRDACIVEERLSMTTQDKLQQITDRNVTIVLLGPEYEHIDEMNVYELNDQLVAILMTLPHPLLVLDMSPTEFFGSSFIEGLFRVWKRLTPQPGAQLALSGLKPYCHELFTVTHLEQLWPIYETYQAASDALNDEFKKS